MSPITNSKTSVFHAPPKTLRVHEGYTKPDSSRYKVESLIQNLSDGPVGCRAHIGPELYEDQPFKLKNQVEGRDIYGWKPGAKRGEIHPEFLRMEQMGVRGRPQFCQIVIGAKITGDNKGLVYFINADDYEDAEGFPYRKYTTHPVDERIYVTSFKTFNKYLQLIAIPADSIPPKV